MSRPILSLLAILLVTSQSRGDDAPKKPGPNSADEPMADHLSLERGARFLDAVAVNWTRERKCGTCHTNYAYMMSRSAVKGVDSPELAEVRSFFEGRVAGWDGPEKGDKPKWDAEVVATAAALALNDAATTGKLHPLTRKALDRIWTVQRADGGWEWLKCDWPPLEHDDYYGAALVAVAVGHAPDDYKNTEAARKGLDKLRGYFRSTPPPDLHHKALLLWASTAVDGLMDPAARDQTVKELLALQRPDGGWSLPSLGEWTRHDKSRNDKKRAPSDGYGTGYVVYVLRQAGVPADSEPIRRGVSWIKTHQRASGRWFTRSPSTDKFHYITHAGTGFALLALSSCGAE
jgi:squalene-hopene/tetraprenyl-beta-curcumene cyclase